MAAPAQTIINNDWPAEYAAEITTSDSTVLSPTPRALYIGGAGDVTVTMASDGTDIVFKNAIPGLILPVRVKKVKAATTATYIVALY